MTVDPPFELDHDHRLPLERDGLQVLDARDRGDPLFDRPGDVLLDVLGGDAAVGGDHGDERVVHVG